MGCTSSVASVVGGPRRLSMRPHSLETRILQIDQVDTLRLEPTPPSTVSPLADGHIGLRALRDLSASTVKMFPKNSLFDDQDFPADNTSLGLKAAPGLRWQRPNETWQTGPPWTGEPKGRIVAGGFDDRWLAEAMAIVMHKPELLDEVFSKTLPEDQNGAVRVKLWRFGKWETVLVDDRLPQPHCISSTSPGEAWPALLEKAFAKVYGSYASLSGGDVLWGLEDLTGGVAQRLPGLTGELYSRVYRPLEQALRVGALVSCTPKSKLQGFPQEIVTSIVVDTKMTMRGPQICIRDGHKENSSSHWMDLQNFFSQYTDITVTTLRTGSQVIQVQEVYGCWEAGISAGGSRNNLEKFVTNPQYVLTIKHPETQEEKKDFGRCNLLVALMQEDRRSMHDNSSTLLPIAYFIYKADSSGERLSAEYFLCVSEEVTTGPFMNKREIAQQTELDPGHYILVPATWSSGQEGAFLLRVFALRKVSLEALPPYRPICAMLPTWVPAADE